MLEKGSAIETANVPAQGHDRIELAHHALARQRGVHQRPALSREIVDHREDAETAAIGERIRRCADEPLGHPRDRGGAASCGS